MSNKVNLEVFEEFGKAIGFKGSISDLVYKMCLNFEDTSDHIECWPHWKDENYRAFKDYFEKQLEIQEYKHLDGDESCEGGGEYCYGVFQLKDKIYKAEYAYYSYDGHQYDGIEYTLKEVTPVQKTITVWE